jgi:hypothetical protein
VLTRQQDDIALDPNRDLIEREIGEVDVLGIDDGAVIGAVIVAVIANETRGSARSYDHRRFVVVRLVFLAKYLELPCRGYADTSHWVVLVADAKSPNL